MRFKTTITATLIGAFLSMNAAAQNAASVIAAASKAMGADNLNSITYSGTARNGAFGQSKSIGDPMGPLNVTQVTSYTRTINFGQAAAPAALVSRATGPTQPPTVPNVPPPMPGVFNQNITSQQAANNFGQALNILTTPWGFLKAAAANNATVTRQGGQQVVSFSQPNFKSPSGKAYTVTGYINNQNLVTKVETRIEHAVIGDMLVEFEYSAYQSMNGLQVPARIVQRQGGLTTFDAAINSAQANPSNLAQLLTPPPPAGGGGGGGAAPAAAAPAGTAVDKLGEGVFRIGGNYTSMAIDMGDHILVIESAQSDQRGMDVMAAAKRAIPNKPIRFVVNSHPHFDHASGLAAAVAEGATILTHNNNKAVLEKLLSGPRTLTGDSLSKVPNRKAVVQGVGDHETRKGTNGQVVELYRIVNDHSDGLLIVYVPGGKVLWTADVNANPTPAQLPTVKAVVALVNRLNMDFNTFITAHLPVPDRPLTKVDLLAAAATGN